MSGLTGTAVSIPQRNIPVLFGLDGLKAKAEAAAASAPSDPFLAATSSAGSSRMQWQGHFREKWHPIFVNTNEAGLSHVHYTWAHVDGFHSRHNGVVQVQGANCLVGSAFCCSFEATPNHAPTSLSSAKAETTSPTELQCQEAKGPVWISSLTLMQRRISFT